MFAKKTSLLPQCCVYGIIFTLIVAISVCSSSTKHVRHHDDLPSTLASVRGDFVKIDGKTYYIHADMITVVNWTTAWQSCDDLNMQLVSIETAEENQAIMWFILNNTQYDWWLWTSGRRDANTTEWNWDATKETLLFTDWRELNPDVPEEMNACLSFWALYDMLDEPTWEDDPCFFMLGYMCE